MKTEYKPIGVIHTPFTKVQGMPIQPAGASSARGTIDLFPECAVGLKDLDGFSNIILLYHFHKSRESKLLVTPFLDSKKRGVFAIRAPTRPNPIGLSVVELLKIEKNVLYIKNVDILYGTPLLDIKPYVPEFDHYQADRIGWLAQAKRTVKSKKADDRFV